VWVRLRPQARCRRSRGRRLLRPAPLVPVPAELAAGDECAWVAALTCSPSWICFSIPAGAVA